MDTNEYQNIYEYLLKNQTQIKKDLQQARRIKLVDRSAMFNKKSQDLIRYKIKKKEDSQGEDVGGSNLSMLRLFDNLLDQDKELSKGTQEQQDSKFQKFIRVKQSIAQMQGKFESMQQIQTDKQLDKYGIDHILSKPNLYEKFKKKVEES